MYSPMFIKQIYKTFIVFTIEFHKDKKKKKKKTFHQI